MTNSKHFLFLLVGEFSHLAFSNAIEPLRIANRMSEKKLYEWSLASEDGAPATASNGTRTLVDYDFGNLPKCDAILVISGNDVLSHITKKLLSVLRRASVQGMTMGAVCSGAFIFAKAGFLTNRKAAMHWEFHSGFSEIYPEVDLIDGVFVKDGRYHTAAGGHAAADLLLNWISEDYGEDLATIIADQMVYNTVRNGNDTQRISVHSRVGKRNATLAKAVKFMDSHLAEHLGSTQIAQTAGVSVRQLERLFRIYMNTSPAKYLAQLRLERARQLVFQTDLSIIEISLACGYSCVSNFRKNYKKAYGVSPHRHKAAQPAYAGQIYDTNLSAS